MNVEELSQILRGRIRTNNPVFRILTDCYRNGGLPCLSQVDDMVPFSSVVSVLHEAIMLQVSLFYGPFVSLLVHLSTTIFVLLRLRVKIKECSRKLNQHGQVWTMRLDRHTLERQMELKEFCDLVRMDRELNDESAEHHRTKDMQSNPESAAYKIQCRTLAEATGGKDFDDY